MKRIFLLFALALHALGAVSLQVSSTTNTALVGSFTNFFTANSSYLTASISNASLSKLDATNGAAVALTGSLTNVTVDGSALLLIPSFVTAISEVVSPAAWQVFQRSTTTSGSVTVTAYVAGPTGTAIEGRYNAGSWQTIGESDPTGLVSGSITNCPVVAAGASVDLRLAGTTNVTTVTNVAVGDVFAIWGQSNGSGRLESDQTYTNGAAVMASMLGNNYVWQTLTDPTDEDDGQVDEISIDTDSERGSVWPLVANIMSSNSVPLAFVQCTRGGTGFSASQPTWVPQSDRFDRATLFGSALYRTRQSGAKAVIWWQGEGWASTSNLYYSNVTNMIGAAVAEIPALKFIPISLQEVVGGNATYQTNTWVAINWLWNSGNSAILNGPTLGTLPIGNTDNIFTEDEGGGTPWYHLKTSTNAQAAAAIIATNLLSHLP